MSARRLMMEAEEARRLLEQYGLDGEEAALAVQSETSIPELISRLIEADAADEAAVKHCSVRAQELRMRAERIEHRREQRRAEIASVLERIGLTGPLDCQIATVSLSERPPAVVILDSEAIPSRFQVTKTSKTPDRVAVGAALRAGQDVPGATLSNARKSVMIRRT